MIAFIVLAGFRVKGAGSWDLVTTSRWGYNTHFMIGIHPPLSQLKPNLFAPEANRRNVF